MDKDEVKACIRALLSSSALSYCLNSLLHDFKDTSGCDLPVFEFPNAVEFLKSLTDTVQLFGDPKNPEVCLIESKKSSHITSLVDRQKDNIKNKKSYFQYRPKRIVIPNGNINNPNLEKPKSLDKSVVKQTRESELFPKESFEFRNTSLRNYSTRNSSNVYNKNVQNLFDSLSSEYNFYEDKPPDKIKSSPEKEKLQDEVCYFKDISDCESCYITGEDSSSKSCSYHPLSSPCNYVNDGMKNKLKKLIEGFPKGLWCCDLPNLFQDMYNLALDYREFGYTSLIQMLSELPDVFRCVRPGNEDWIVFDASTPPSPEERKMLNSQLLGDVASEMKSNLQKLLFSECETSSNLGVELNRIPSLYKRMFGRPLDFQSLGFKNLESFLDTLEGTWFNVYDINNKLIVVPMLKTFVHSPLKWEEALPPITAENDIFYEIFPEDVVGPEESLLELDLTRHIAVGQTVEVCVAEVWSPGKFYLQLNKFKNRLNGFMDDLQNFYNIYLNKYKMPDATIRPKQVCVGLYNSDPEFPEEWHRAQIVKVINEKTVSVNFVDYGTVTRVKKSQLRFLHQSFRSFPIQAFLARLEGVLPVHEDKRWPVLVSKRFLELLRVPYLKAEMVEIDFKKPSMNVILHDPLQTDVLNINQRLVSEKLARVDKISPSKPPTREKNVDDLTTSYSNTSKSSMESVNLNSSGAADSPQKENLNKKSPETFDGFFEIPDLENNAMQQIQTDCLEVVPDLETPPSVKPPEIKLEFDEVLDFKNSRGRETSEDDNAARIQTETLEVKEFLRISPPESHGHQNPDKTNPKSVSNKPERLPSRMGDSPHLFDFTQIQFLMLEQQRSEMKKKINLLAVELLATNLTVKEIALSYPELAMKVATQLAETYVGLLYSNTLPLYYLNGFVPVLPNVLTSDFGGLMPPGSTVFEANQNIDTIPLTSGNPTAPAKPSGTLDEINFSDATNASPSPTNNDGASTSITTNTTTSNSYTNNSASSSMANKNCVNTSNITDNNIRSSIIISNSSCFSITTNNSASANITTNNVASSSGTTNNTANSSNTNSTSSSMTNNNCASTNNTTDDISTSITNNIASTITDMGPSKTNNSASTTTDSSKTNNSTTSTSVSTTSTGTSISGNTKTQDLVEKVEIGSKNLHLVKFESDTYFCVEEIIQSFTVISNREIADRIFQVKRIRFQYKVLTKKANEEVINALKKHAECEVIFKKKKKKKLEIHLLHVKKLLSYLEALGCHTKPYEDKIQDILNKSATPVKIIQS